MANIIEYKCPHCGGKLEFNSDVQKLKCPYCDSEVTIEEANKITIASDPSPDIPQDTFGTDADGFGLYKCSSCGAEIIADETTAATNCPYCSNAVILTGRIAGQLRPDIIIPFKVSKEDAKAALQKHFQGKKLLPNVFSDENHLDEIKGVYVPFFIYDTDAHCESSYSATKVRVWTDARYNYTETEDYRIDRSGSMTFRNVPVDGLKEIDNDITESLEVFDVSEAVPFNTAYLSGFFAHRYDVDSQECKVRARERISNSINSEVDATVSGYNTVSKTSSSTELSNTKIRYAFFPIWILNTSWRDKTYLFAMNGQSGKFVGDLPLDKGKYWIQRLLWGGGIGAVLLLLWELIAGGAIL